jgi:hypothetical protein
MIAGGIAGLSAIILVLSGTIAYELVSPDIRPAGLSTGAGHLPNVATGSRAAQSQNDIDGSFGEILARPVFSPDRRPIGPGAHSIAGLSRLTGIVVNGSSKVAIFAAPAGGKPIVAEEGSHINAYEVKAINDSGVTVIGPGGTIVMTPNFDVAPPQVTKRPLPTLPELARTQKNNVPNGRP